MTNEKISQVGLVISTLVNLSVDIIIGYQIGKMFHSFFIGLAVYSVLSGLSSINLKLSRRS